MAVRALRRAVDPPGREPPRALDRARRPGGEQAVPSRLAARAVSRAGGLQTGPSHLHARRSLRGLRVLGFVTLFITAFVTTNAAAQSPALAIVNSGPRGPLSGLEQANEIRIVFSEPMVSLGRIPTPLVPPFFHVTPAVQGTFRWSGTTILVFTPNSKAGLPYATRFDVTIDAGAADITVRLPSEVGARLVVEAGPHTIEATGLTRDGNVYTNAAYGVSKVTWQIDMQPGIGLIKLEVAQAAAKP